MSEQILVREIVVRSPGEPVNQEIILPEGTKGINKLFVEVDPGGLQWSFIQLSSLSCTVFGHLNLRQDNQGDIFFQCPVKLAVSFEENYKPMGLSHPAGIPHGSPGFAGSGKIRHGWEFEPPLSPLMLSIHYRDQINAHYGITTSYSVRLYLHLEQ